MLQRVAPLSSNYNQYMDLGARKTFFMISDQVRLKLVCSDTETSQNIDFLHVAILASIRAREE